MNLREALVFEVAREQHEQGCCVREGELGAQGDNRGGRAGTAPARSQFHSTRTGQTGDGGHVQPSVQAISQ